jgi:sigma-B regulation protein RsbU (phosphoserine phosphatase)
MKKPTLQLALLAVLLAWSLACQVILSGTRLYSQWEEPRHVQAPFLLETYTTTIGRIPFQYRGEGLRRGDDVMALNGAAVDGNEQIAIAWMTGRPNDLMSVTVRRTEKGQTKTVTVPIRLQAGIWNPVEWVLAVMVDSVLPLSCLLVGFYIAFARPRDPLAWITMAMLTSFGHIAGGPPSPMLWSPWRELIYVYQPLLNSSWPLWLLLFAFYFPIPFEFITRNKWVGWVLAIPFVVLTGLAVYGNFETGRHIHQLGWLSTMDAAINTPVTVLFTLYVFAFFFFLGWKRHILTALDARRRLRLMTLGCTASLLPTLPVFLGQAGIIRHLPFWVFTACLSMLVFFPFTMAYVIVVQRAMDVRMVVRNGVKYAFATTGVRILMIGIGIVVGSLTNYYARQSDHLIIAGLIVAVGILLIVSLRKMAKHMRLWTDRQFFREAYSAELLLTELSNSVAGIRDTKTLLETVSKRISESLHVPRIAVFLERSGIYQPAYALGFPAPPPVEFKAEAGTVRFLKRLQAPSRIYFEDPQSWVHGTAETEQEALRQVGSQLLLPLSLKSRLLGIISLGSKLSEEPYSRADIQLLSAVASQTGLALENAELTESIRREIVQRERLDRELEIAREVQQRLFPQKLPVVSGLDFAGYCRPAEGVGGDYYDFIHLPDGSLGIAVGDVSGKGIAAALMMASLQASLRGQTIKPCETLGEMIGNINQLVFEASSANRYATFFYAQYDPVSLKLRYVNAGHNPPLVWRFRDGEHTFFRLEEGGTVVGLFPDFPFSEATVQLEKGDVVVAYTDGISEAMNTAEDEYGEERLMQALQHCKARSAADMSNWVLDQVDRFTAGAKQNDDMTLVILRVH